MNEDATQFEEHEVMFFPQDPSTGPCKMVLGMTIFNPDGRGIKIEFPHVQINPDSPLKLYLGDHRDGEDRNEYVGLELPASKIIPQGFIKNFTLTLLDPEPAEEMVEQFERGDN